MSEGNYQEMIEQLRHDRDKYIGMWRSKCQMLDFITFFPVLSCNNLKNMLPMFYRRH